MSFGGSNPTSQTTSTQAPAYALPYLQSILGEASNIYNQGQTAYYPSSTVAGASPETQTALSGIRDTAMAGNPLTQPMTDLATQTLRGDFLSGDNKYLQGAIKQATDPMISNFQTNVAPSIDSQFAGSGRLGSGLYAQARNRAEDTLTDSMADTGQDIAYRNYANERAKQQGLLNQASAISQIPYQDYNVLAGVGKEREAYDQADINDAVKRFQAEQNNPFAFLNEFADLINKGTFGSDVVQPVSSDKAGQLLSTLIMLGNIGSGNPMSFLNPFN
tara:strand:- start:714 stop:1538 length:825 start_codon:yes stop_codon:yes gene_type:complete